MPDTASSSHTEVVPSAGCCQPHGRRADLPSSRISARSNPWLPRTEGAHLCSPRCSLGPSGSSIQDNLDNGDAGSTVVRATLRTAGLRLAESAATVAHRRGRMPSGRWYCWESCGRLCRRQAVVSFTRLPRDCAEMFFTYPNDLPKNLTRTDPAAGHGNGSQPRRKSRSTALSYDTTLTGDSQEQSLTTGRITVSNGGTRRFTVSMRPTGLSSSYVVTISLRKRPTSFDSTQVAHHRPQRLDVNQDGRRPNPILRPAPRRS